MKQFAQQTINAITITSSPFGESDCIATLYSREHGLLKCIAKRARNPKNPYRNLTTPLGHGEFTLSKGKNTLFRFHEGTITHHYFALRTNREALDSACGMLDAIRTTQLELHPSPPLYDLLYCYLQLVNTIQNPKSVLSSFLLKLLLHEGLISITADTITPQLTQLSAEEVEAIFFLAYNRNSTQLTAHALSEVVHATIHYLFDALTATHQT